VLLNKEADRTLWHSHIDIYLGEVCMRNGLVNNKRIDKKQICLSEMKRCLNYSCHFVYSQRIRISHSWMMWWQRKGSICIYI